MSNLLIVESQNDQYFIEALIAHMNIDIEVGQPICQVDEYECLGGIGKLDERLKALSHRIIKGELERVGIIFDADKVGIAKRTEQIQEKINEMVEELPKEFHGLIDFFIYIQNHEGYGELESVLKMIKKSDSTIADCLESWQECLPDGKKVSQKDFDKFWIQVYQRYDCCTKKEQKQAGIKCNNEISLKEKDIWNFDHEILNDLKTFLTQLGE